MKHLSIDVVHIIFFFFYWNSSLNVIFFYWNTILIWCHPLLNRVIWYIETSLYDIWYMTKPLWKLLYSVILLHKFEGGGMPSDTYTRKLPKMLLMIFKIKMKYQRLTFRWIGWVIIIRWWNRWGRIVENISISWQVCKET